VVKFLHERIKVGNKTNNLGDLVKITAKGSIIEVISRVQMSKRYIKYLTKKYLKSQSLRDMMRVVATNKQTYKVVFLAIGSAEDDEEEEEEKGEEETKMEQ